jgi:hypothetical protein
MSYTRNKSWYVVIGLMLIVLSGIILFGLTQVANAAERDIGRHEFIDSRHGHDHVYPARGHYIERLPSGYRTVAYGKSRYYFHEGVWYRPEGRRFVIVAPPFGLVVPLLPLYYTTLLVGGMPYYYANEVYYTQTAGGYVVVEAPKGEVMQAPPATPLPASAPAIAKEEKLFIYPRKGQSEKQQAKDRYECHSWAVSQTGYDPTQPTGGTPESQANQKRADYQRAIGACLDARGYTAK